MNEETRALLLEAHHRLHVHRFARSGSPPADDEQLVQFEKQFGRIPGDYRWYLGACGGGYVGAQEIDGIGDLSRDHALFRKECNQGLWEEADNVFVFGKDGMGSWVGIRPATGKVVAICEDGDVEVLADSFELFLIVGLLENGKLPEPLKVTTYEPRIGADDCETHGKKHEWYNADGRHSGCYHCQTVKIGQLWRKK